MQRARVPDTPPSQGTPCARSPVPRRLRSALTCLHRHVPGAHSASHSHKRKHPGASGLPSTSTSTHACHVTVATWRAPAPSHSGYEAQAGRGGSDGLPQPARVSIEKEKGRTARDARRPKSAHHHRILCLSAPTLRESPRHCLPRASPRPRARDSCGSPARQPPAPPLAPARKGLASRRPRFQPCLRLRERGRDSTSHRCGGLGGGSVPLRSARRVPGTKAGGLCRAAPRHAHE